ncbi:hypothetical protein [Kordiimonas sp.]|uniref:hypothetical protein n=1 Tax=Kordiimonas sp. TaxID=1970157 RepID=UPI003A8D5F6A
MPDGDQQTAFEAQLEEYLRICNAALKANSKRFPYNRLWEAGAEALKGRSVELALVDDEPKARCRITLSAHHIERATEDGEAPPVTRLSKQYIDDVLANPEKYISDPSLIDWRWLKCGGQTKA